METRFVWLDMEMTGLDPDACAVVELAMVVTGADLEPIAEMERLVWQPEEVLLRTNPFVREMHTKNGLFERVRRSTTGLEDVQRDALGFLVQHTAYREGILAGTSIHQDRRFLVRHLPLFEAFLHYRQVDVSSLKVLVGAWTPEHAFKKAEKAHTALEDVKASLAEARHYRERLFARAP